eukprot:scpid62183/ scgid31121/ 
MEGSSFVDRSESVRYTFVYMTVQSRSVKSDPKRKAGARDQFRLHQCVCVQMYVQPRPCHFQGVKGMQVEDAKCALWVGFHREQLYKESTAIHSQTYRMNTGAVTPQMKSN